MLSTHTIQSNCPITNTKGIKVFNFNTPLAGAFLKTKNDIEKEIIFPLTLSFYPESSLLMVNERINPNILFSNYFYKTGASKHLENHFINLSNIVKSKLNPKKILEIGCNDFTFLKNFDNCFCVGVDPSDVSKNNVPKSKTLVNSFFSYKKSKEIYDEHGYFDLIVATNSFAHINDIVDAVKGVENILANGGTFLVEVNWLQSLINNNQFPFIYHEHIYYYTLKSFQNLLNTVGMEVYDVEYIPTHGGSLRIFSKRISDYKEISNSVNNFMLIENEGGSTNLKFIKKFFAKIKNLKKDLIEKIKQFKNSGRRIIGYGASGQSTTLLSILGIDSSLIDFLVDDSPLKLGCYAPGTHLEIKSKDHIDAKNDIVLVLAYTFFDEIKSRLGPANYLIPLPEIKEIFKNA